MDENVVEVESAVVKTFDGEALEDRLARRSRNWIADVRVATAS